MDELLTWPGRIYPSSALVVMGAGLIVAGLRAALPTHKPTGWPEWALLYLVVFRRTVVGACVAVAGVAWLSSIAWLVGLAVCVGVGELLESSYYIGVLRWGERRGFIATSSG